MTPVNRLLKNKLLLAILLPGLALLAARNWIAWLSSDHPPSLPQLPAGMPTLSDFHLPARPMTMAAPSRASADLPGVQSYLRIRTVPPEDALRLASLFGLSGKQVDLLRQLNQTPHPDEPRLVIIPRDWRGEMKPPRDPFLWSAEEPPAGFYSGKDPDLLAIRRLLHLDNNLDGADGGMRRQLQVVVVNQAGAGAVSVGGRVLRVGERLEGYQIVRANMNGILLRNQAGLDSWLAFQLQEKNTVRVEVARTIPGGE